MKISLKKSAFIIIIMSLSLSLFSCENEENKADARGAGVNFLNSLFSPYPIYIMNGTLNLDYTQSCGSVSQATSTTTTTTPTATPGTSTTNPVYNIASFFMIDVAKSTFNYPVATATITARFKYDERNSKFTISSLNTTPTTCKTIDNISCNTTGTLTCDTIDNIKCGGTETFIYTSQSLPSYSVIFQAYTGTIDWSNGFTLSNDKTRVVYADLKFDMVSKDNSIFTGRLNCQAPQY